MTTKPVLFIVDDEPTALAAIERDLLLALASRVESLEAGNEVQTGRGVLSLVLLVVGYITGGNIINMRSWNQAVSYSRTGRIPGT